MNYGRTTSALGVALAPLLETRTSSPRAAAARLVVPVDLSGPARASELPSADGRPDARVQDRWANVDHMPPFMFRVRNLAGDPIQRRPVRTLCVQGSGQAAGPGLRRPRPEAWQAAPLDRGLRPQARHPTRQASGPRRGSGELGGDGVEAEEHDEAGAAEVVSSCLSSATMDGRARASAPGSCKSMSSLTACSVQSSPTRPSCPARSVSPRREVVIAAARAAAAAADTDAPSDVLENDSGAPPTQ